MYIKTTKLFSSLTALLFTVVLLFSCRGNQLPKSEKFELTEGFDYVHLIPDSLRTPEQRELFLLLLDVIIKNMVIENSHFVFKLNRTEFIEKGIPEPYYDLIMNDVKQNNAYIDSAGLENVDSLLKNAFQQIESHLCE